MGRRKGEKRSLLSAEQRTYGEREGEHDEDPPGSAHLLDDVSDLDTPHLPTRTRRRSTVPGLTEAEVAKRTRYRQFYSRDNEEPELYEDPSKESIHNSIQYHLELLGSFREQPWSMRKKLRTSRKTRAFLKRPIQRVGGMKQLNTTQRMRMQKYSKSVDNLFHTLKIWRDPIKKIEGYFGSSVASYFLFLRTFLWLNLILVGEHTQINITDGLDFVRDTIIFYGVYDYHESVGLGYMLPMAYFVTTAALYLFCLVALVRRMVVKYRKTKRLGDSEEYPFTWRCFCSWDFTISSKEGVRDKIQAIRTDLKELIREIKVKGTKSPWVLVYLARLLCNITVLAILGATGYLIYFFVERQDDVIELGIPDFAEEFLQKYQLSLVMSGLKLVVPVLFTVMVKLERWHPRVELKWLLARTTVFYYASLAVLTISLYQVATRCKNPGKIHRNTTCCYETVVGEEVAKVFLGDLAAMIVSILILDVLRAILVKSSKLWERKASFAEFSISENVLEVIYGQGLIWLGLYFSPFLPVVAMVKVVIMFYLRYLVAKSCNIPPKKMFRASRSGNFYLTLLLVTLFLCLIPVGYGIIVIRPSPDCGAFRKYEHVYEVVTSRIGRLPDWLFTVINILFSPAVVIPFCIVLLLIIIYYRARASSYQELIADLRTQLHFERSVGKRKILAAAQSKFTKTFHSVSDTDVSLV